jgi:hypothetical protein
LSRGRPLGPAKPQAESIASEIQTNPAVRLSSVDFTALPYSDYEIRKPTNTFEDEEIRHVQPGWPAEGRDNAAITTFHS